MPKIEFPEFVVNVYQASGDNGCLDSDKAKELLGWDEVDEGHTLKLPAYLGGQKIVLNNVPTNRPFSMGRSQRYMREMLLGRWELNGQAVAIFDRLGHCQNGQHTLVALILAELERQARAAFWVEEGADKKKLQSEVTIEGLVSSGIDNKDHVIDTIDTGSMRTITDVFYRKHLFGKEVTESQARRLASVYASAARTCWIRLSGQRIAGAGKFNQTDAVQFHLNHPKLLECVIKITELNGGQSAESGQKITGSVKGGTLIPLQRAAGMMYLMATSSSEWKMVDGRRVLPTEIDTSNFKKAEDFWRKFADGPYPQTAKDPVYNCKEWLRSIGTGGSTEREMQEMCVVRAWQLFTEDESGTKAMLKVWKDNRKEGTKVVQKLYIGGLDTAPPKPEPSDKFPVKNYAGYGEGEQVWVEDTINGHWCGTINGFSKNRMKVDVHFPGDAETGEEENNFAVDITDVSKKKPTSKVEAPPEPEVVEEEDSGDDWDWEAGHQCFFFLSAAGTEFADRGLEWCEATISKTTKKGVTADDESGEQYKVSKDDLFTTQEDIEAAAAEYESSESVPF